MWTPRLLLLTALCLCLPGLARAQAPDPCGPGERDAQRLAQEGLRLYKDAGALADPGERTKGYERALRCYQAVLRVGANPVLIYHPLGLVYEKLERHVEAVEALERFLREVPEAERRVGVTKQIDDKLRDLAGRVARLDVDTVAGLEVRVDQRLVGKAPLGRLVVVLPGTHSVVVGDAERGTLGAQAVARPGEVHRVELGAWRPRDQQAAPVASVAQVRTGAPASAARPIYKRWWFWGAIGLVAAGVTTAAVVGTRPWEPKSESGVFDVRF
jgi:hypothetical protein